MGGLLWSIFGATFLKSSVESCRDSNKKSQALVLLAPHPGRLRTLPRLRAEAPGGKTAPGRGAKKPAEPHEDARKPVLPWQGVLLEFFQHLYCGKVSDAFAMLRQAWGRMILSHRAAVSLLSFLGGSEGRGSPLLPASALCPAGCSGTSQDPGHQTTCEFPKILGSLQ